MQRALVIGLGKSGISVSQLLKKQGFHVTGIDSEPPHVEGIETLSESAQLKIGDFDLVVPSPGIPPHHPYYAQALAEHLPIRGEADIALGSLQQTTVAVTGTNGKTTVTLLIAHILQNSGYQARALGNIGTPLSAYALQPIPSEILVVELSSYQLETMRGEFFYAGAILNITPDHLDRYPSLHSYAAAKWRLQYCLQKPERLFIYRPILDNFSDLCTVDITPYEKGANHDAENCRAAWLISQELGVTQEQFENALPTFKKPAHRIEYLGTICGVRYYDDSKGTNTHAVISAVNMMEGAVWLIAGGVDKGDSYTVWEKSFTGKVRKIFALGQARKKLVAEASPFCIVEEVSSLEEAVNRAACDANWGDNVLLSPGCSSFDMFEDYAHRGREFQRCVRALTEREKS
jgi:UDP-N-acetylmuramoylalanine--D-glutamate ligase